MTRREPATLYHACDAPGQKHHLIDSPRLLASEPAPEPGTEEHHELLEKTYFLSYSPSAPRNKVQGPSMTPMVDQSRTFRHSGWVHRRECTFNALRNVSAPAATLQRFEDCGSYANVECAQTAEGETRYRIRCDRCHNRWCVPCATERHRVIARNLATWVEKRVVRHLTLTVRGTPDLKADLDLLYTAWAKLRKKQPFCKAMAGGVYITELTRNSTTGCWHPHLHVLFEGAYIWKETIREAWRELTGGSFCIDIRILDGPKAAAHYVTSYLGKTVDAAIWQNGPAFEEVICVLHGRRMFGTFGTWKTLKLTEVDDDLIWTPVAPLRDLLDRASGGDLEARRILASLRRTGDVRDNIDDRDRAPPTLPTVCDQNQPPF